MPNFTKITFDHPINISLQVGDAVYSATHANGVVFPSQANYLAKVLEVGDGYIIIDIDSSTTPVTSSGDFILFSKPIEVNESSLKGYYADVTFENSSNKRTELFAISSEAVLSSK